MSLESIQTRSNKNRSVAANISASNDPAQFPHDAREQIIKGAELAAAGRTLGMSEEETLAAVSRQFRRQSRADDKVTAMDVMRQMAQAGNTAVADVGTPEIRGAGYGEYDDEAFAFGEDVEYNQLNRKSGGTRADDEQTYRANDRGFTEDEETGLVRRESFEETRGNQDPVAPKSALRDAIEDLERAKGRDTGVMKAITQLFGGSAPVDTEIDTATAALARHLAAEGPQDARIGRAIVRQDRQRFNPEVMEANDWRADAEAQELARSIFTAGGSGGMADENIGRIAEIRNLGKIGETAQVIASANDAILGQAARRQDGVYLDPATGNPLAIQGPEIPEAIANRRVPLLTSPGNIPGVQTAADFVNAVAPGYKDPTQGAQFGDYPQANITRSTTNFSNALRDRLAYLGVNVNSNPNIRSIPELNAAAEFYAKTMREAGKTSMVRDQETNKTTPAGPRIVQGMMDDLRMSPGVQSELANSLFQLDAASRSQVNQNPTGTYLSRATKQGPEMMGTASRSFDPGSGQYGTEASFDSPEAMTGGVATPIGRQKKGSKIRVGTDSRTGKPVEKDIVAALAALGTPDAQKPLIGQTAERPTNPLSSFKGDQVYNRTGLSDPEEIRSYLDELAATRKPADTEIKAAQNTNNANAAISVARRANAAQTREAEQMSAIIASLPPSARRSIFPRGSR